MALSDPFLDRCAPLRAGTENGTAAVAAQRVSTPCPRRRPRRSVHAKLPTAVHPGRQR